MCASTVITHQHQCDSRVSVQFSSNNVFAVSVCNSQSKSQLNINVYAVWYSRPCSSQTEKTGSLRTVVTICFKCLRCADLYSRVDSSNVDTTHLLSTISSTPPVILYDCDTIAVTSFGVWTA
jgi:hypothetical protein